MDKMKDYKQLIRELPSNTIVCAVGEFNPPTVGHELLVKTVKKLAEQKSSAHVIYTSPSKNSLIQEDKKEHYLNLMFPKTKFKSLNESKLQEVITELHKKYKKVILVVGTDQITEMRKLQDVELIPVDKDPEADNTKMKQFASKGIYEEFKKRLPSTIRDIDGKRLMNEMRSGLGLDPIKEQIVFVKDKLREKYFRGEIFNEGDIVESNGEKFTIVKRGSNHLLLKESTGKLISKWIQDVKPTEEKEMNESKLEEGAIQPNGTDKIDTKTSEPTSDVGKFPQKTVKKGMITFYNYTKAQKIQEQEEHSKADKKKDNESDHDYENQIKVTDVDQSEVGHTLVSAGGQDNLRRRKVKYHLGEQTGIEIAKKIMKKGMTSYGKESGHELTAQHIATDPEHTGKEKDIAKSFISKLQGVAENVTPDPKSNEVAKTNLMAKHAKEKESLADKQTREKDALKESEYTGKGAGKPGWMLRADPKLALALKAAKQRRKFVAGNPTKTNESLEESHVEFRIDNRDKVSGDHKPTFAAHDAKVSDTTDKATYVKVPSHKADAFKSAMKSKHGVRVELAESRNQADKYYDEAEKHKALAMKHKVGTEAHHSHMADHFDAMHRYHSDIGQSDAASKAADKAEQHHDKAYSLKESALEKFRAAAVEREKKHDEIERKRKEDAAQGKENMSGAIDRLEKSLKQESPSTLSKKPFDPFFEEEELAERAKLRRKFINGQWVVDTTNTVDETYDQTIEVATPITALETSEEDDVDDKEIEAMIGQLSDDDIMDDYDEEELGLVDDETGEEIPKSDEEDALDEEAIMEVLSRIERMKAKFRIRRTAAKRERATKIALKRYSNTATINKRARRLAIKLMKQRLLRGRDVSKLSVGEKERIERALEQRKAVIGRIATRLVPRVRKVEKARMSHSKFTQGSQPSVF